VTEIPEHLLKRSKQRRAAIGGEGGDAPEGGGDATAGTSAEPAAATPATTPAAAAAPVEAPPPPPEPVRPEVEAYQRRRRIPYWAMPVLAFVPLWAYMFQATLEPPPAELEGGIATGGQIYSASCSGCHGATGGGVGSNPGFADVLEVFPDYRDHMLWVKVGSSGWPGDTYGANDKPKSGALMPPHPTLSDEELAAVVLYERQMFGGLGEAEEEELRQLADGEDVTFADLGLGEASEAAGLDESALEPGG
jgi:mono/diheme cytochrome c family protein